MTSTRRYRLAYEWRLPNGQWTTGYAPRDTMAEVIKEQEISERLPYRLNVRIEEYLGKGKWRRVTK
jgi:hypothetical protein